MAVDASIPLAANTQGPDIGRVFHLAEVMQEFQQRKQQMEGVQTLKSILAGPGAFDENGRPSPAALQKMMQADPYAAQQFEKNSIAIDAERERLNDARLKRMDTIHALIDPVRDAALNAHDEVLKRGGSLQHANEEGQRVLDEGLAPIRSGGQLSEQEKQQLRTQFDYIPMKAAALSYKERVAQSNKDRDFAETKRHNMAEEGRGVYGNPTEVMVDDGTGKKRQVLAQQNKATGAWVSADDKRAPLKVTGISGKEIPEAGDPDVEAAAKMIANYQMAPLTGFAMRSPYGQAVMARVSQINPDYQATQFSSRNKAMSSFATGKQGDAIRSFNVGISHLNTLSGLVDALNNKDMQAFNRVANKVKEEMGQAAPANFDAAKAIVGDEIIKAIIGGGGALADRENAQNQIDRAKSPEQLKGVIDTYKDLMAGQLTGLKKQYEDTTGLKNFDDRLSDETKRQLESHGRGKSAGAMPPAAAVAKLKKGVQTTFGNGQVWTLGDDGKPVQVK